MFVVQILSDFVWKTKKYASNCKKIACGAIFWETSLFHNTSKEKKSRRRRENFGVQKSYLIRQPKKETLATTTLTKQCASTSTYLAPPNSSVNCLRQNVRPRFDFKKNMLISFVLVWKFPNFRFFLKIIILNLRDHVRFSVVSQALVLKIIKLLPEV